MSWVRFDPTLTDKNIFKKKLRDRSHSILLEFVGQRLCWPRLGDRCNSSIKGRLGWIRSFHFSFIFRLAFLPDADEVAFEHVTTDRDEVWGGEE